MKNNCSFLCYKYRLTPAPCVGVVCDREREKSSSEASRCGTSFITHTHTHTHTCYPGNIPNSPRQFGTLELSIVCDRYHTPHQEPLEAFSSVSLARMLLYTRPNCKYSSFKYLDGFVASSNVTRQQSCGTARSWGPETRQPYICDSHGYVS